MGRSLSDPPPRTALRNWSRNSAPAPGYRGFGRWVSVGCDHTGTHSGQARYLRDVGALRLLLVCDGCSAERIEFGRLDYRPNAQRVDGHLAELTARELGLSEARVAKVRLAALLSGIGRDQIPPEILNKREPLDDAEWAEIRRQPEVGAALLSGVSS